MDAKHFSRCLKRDGQMSNEVNQCVVHSERRFEQFVIAVFPGIDRNSTQFFDLRMTFFSGAVTTVNVVHQHNIMGLDCLSVLQHKFGCIAEAAVSESNKRKFQ